MSYAWCALTAPPIYTIPFPTDSCFRLHSASMSTLIILRPHRSANRRHPSRRIMLPISSSSTNSHSTPARGRPVSAHRSTPVSVCPRRSRTPPARARRGTMCPGRENCVDREEGEASARAVRARSCAEIPVVVPGVIHKRMHEVGARA